MLLVLIVMAFFIVILIVVFALVIVVMIFAFVFSVLAMKGDPISGAQLLIGGTNVAPIAGSRYTNAL
jgi:hypothetical protein